MQQLRLHYYGAPLLRTRAREITCFDEELVEVGREMSELMDRYHGQGLAAPQMGLDIRLFVCRFRSDQGLPYEEWLQVPIDIVINPVIVPITDEFESSVEGCISLPGLQGKVSRPVSILMKALDIHGNPIERELHGSDARVVMHENDHLNGVLFFDRMAPGDRKKFKKKLNRLIATRDEYQYPFIKQVA